MCRAVPLSEQFFECSDEPTNEVDILPANPKRFPPQASCRYRPAHPARVSHHAVSPLRKAGMQVCGWPWARPQVLPLGQLSRSTTRTGLRTRATPEARGEISGQLPETQDSSGTTLRHQQGASAKEGGPVADAGGSSAAHPNRCPLCRNDSRQHVAESLGCEPRTPNRSQGGYR